MNASWKCLVGLLAVGLQAGLAVAQGPESPSPLPMMSPATGTMQDVPASAPYAPSGGAAPDQAGLIGGVGIYLLQPYFQNNLAYTVFTQQQFTPLPFNANQPNTQTLSETASRVDVHTHMAVAPLLWLGYVNEDGFGGRLRWWSLREGTSQTMNLPPFAGPIYLSTAGGQTVIAVTGNQATISSAAPLGLQSFGNTVGVQHGAEATSFAVTTELSIQVGDAEAVQEFDAAGCKFLFAGGLRLVRIGQTYNAYDAQSGGPAELRTLLSSYIFTGLGPTIALEARRPVGETGLSLYGQARGSLVFGTAQQNASFGGQELRNNDPNPQFATDHHSRALPITELEVGMEYGRSVGTSWIFGQIALVGQEWFGAGGSSRSTPTTVASTLRPVLGGTAVDSNISFLGLSLRLGLDY